MVEDESREGVNDDTKPDAESLLMAGESDSGKHSPCSHMPQCGSEFPLVDHAK